MNFKSVQRQIQDPFIAWLNSPAEYSLCTLDRVIVTTNISNL